MLVVVQIGKLKEAHALKINVCAEIYSKTLLEIKKDFYMVFWGNIKLGMSFLGQVYKYIFKKYNCTERRVLLLVPVVQIGGWVGQIKSKHCF